MYNHYLDDGSFVLLDPDPQPLGQPGANHQGQPRHVPSQGQNQRRPSAPRFDHQRRVPELPHTKNDLLKDVTGGLSQLLEGVFKHFSLENFDTGDILLVLIILFLYLEDGDNLELVITLGLLLLLGLDGNEANPEDVT